MLTLCNYDLRLCQRAYKYIDTYDLNVDIEKLSEVGRNVADDHEHDPVIRELTEYQRQHRQ